MDTYLMDSDHGRVTRCTMHCLGLGEPRLLCRAPNQIKSTKSASFRMRTTLEYLSPESCMHLLNFRVTPLGGLAISSQWPLAPQRRHPPTPAALSPQPAMPRGNRN